MLLLSLRAFIVALQLRSADRRAANIVSAFKKETNLIYRENTHSKCHERVGVISLLSCCLLIHGNNLREEAD